ncbi:MAG: hypothetical protein J6P89_09680 [Oscillospiraceae bacterium]|nr:hypothetical protein [Oscillospiraceae bacterium]
MAGIRQSGRILPLRNDISSERRQRHKRCCWIRRSARRNCKGIKKHRRCRIHRTGRYSCSPGSQHRLGTCLPEISALVTDVGAPLSHAVIVARELGIPAVVSCQSASAQIHTGDRIRVDGTLGKVFVV